MNETEAKNYLKKRRKEIISTAKSPSLTIEHCHSTSNVRSYNTRGEIKQRFHSHKRYSYFTAEEGWTRELLRQLSLKLA